MKRFRILLGLLIFAPVLTLAEVETSTDLEFQVSTRPEAKLILHQSFIFPFLQGSSPLTQDNNITAVLSAEIAPVSMNGNAEIIWSPAAFLLLSGGGRAGSGWPMPLGRGIGINRPVGDYQEGEVRLAEPDGEAFDGLLWSGWGAATLQFDLGAVMAGDWNHVLFQARQEFRYAAYSRAGSGDSWIFENDLGENRNGWKYYATYVLGYHMPLSPLLDTVAVMAELEKNLYNSPGGDFWGDGLGYWIFSGFVNLSFNPRLSTLLGVQMHTQRNHGSSNFGDRDLFYQDLELISDGGQRRLLFSRVAAIVNFKLR
ncbi:MAG: hypothetical protein FWH19_01850 [Treponema sp.]|nr:hypothetical protein [Treponema sp.]